MPSPFFSPQVSRKYLNLRELITNLMSPTRNFKMYREKISSLLESNHKTCIPCVEIVLKDLLYQTEGESNTIDSSCGLVNFSKMDKMGNLIYSLLKCKKNIYNFVFEPSIYQFLNNLVSAASGEELMDFTSTLLSCSSILVPTADELLDMSLEVEPREEEGKDVGR
eukprot:TRINITY_DN2016_c0_g1_i13.p1 TRINITY_DN2016_c0_g1~~TRINITY_DN2016_c0_g1_i13.p1  ORF type:complete len:166 (-),score=33.32 TRINITY_DN2016_c0_g1_i13:170-667(-)